ncbi:restriction endonuclease subunit S [Deinococcus sp.]|uniref:restriction endonuclease subunit S n=1 Tax=Deinococcus sp. TaxID=47478 RepID=UPI003B5AA7EC
MIHALTPYPAMKDSGVPWLGQVPEHWAIKSLGSMIKARSERSRPDLPLLSVVREKGVILRDRESKGENHNFIPDDLSNYKVVREGDLVVNKMKAWQGSMGLAPVDGIVSPAYFVFDFDIQNRLYGQALLRSRTYVAFFARASDGVRIGQWDLSVDGMKRIPVLVPGPAEQTAIVRYLDHADRRIRRTIAAKQKLIKLLQEQKQVIIHQAVTRGLDPNVKLKPNGVEWLGDVPEGWEVKRVSSISDFLNGKAHEQFVEPDGEFICVTARFVSTGGEGNRRCTANFCPGKKGDIFMVMSDLPKGRALARAYYVDDDRQYAVNQRVCILRAFAIKPKFLAYFANRNSQLLVHDDGFNQTHLSNYDFKTLRVPVPPFEEQEKIVAELDSMVLNIDSLVLRNTTEIALLREYRTRLIADVVTGKLDVRAAAALLPDADAEAEALPEDVDLLGEEGELGEGELEGVGEEVEA